MQGIRRPLRYTSFAPASDVLSGERPVYRTGRVCGIDGLRLRPGALVLDCTDVQAWSLRGGHIQVRAGTLRSP